MGHLRATTGPPMRQCAQCGKPLEEPKITISFVTFLGLDYYHLCELDCLALFVAGLTR
jgi:hypothetical protein